MAERLPDQDPRTDEGLMLAYKNGDAAAFEVLYGRWRRPLFRYVAHQCGHDGASDELFQDIWLRVVNARQQYEAAAKFSTWLFRIAHNRLVDHWRSSHRAPVIDRKAMAEHIVAAVHSLPDVQRETFLLSQDGNMSLEEIASLMNVGRETVKSRLRYALGKLRQELSKWR